MGQLSDKHQLVLPAAVSQRLCAGADRKIAPIVCELLRINTINLWWALALILPVNSLSVLQHIGFQSPHLGNSSSVCLEIALTRALCLRAAKPDEEQGRRRWFRRSKGRSRKRVRMHTKENCSLPAGGCQHQDPDSCGPGSGAAVFAEQAGDSFFLSSKGAATGEFAGVFLACNQKIQFYD